MDLDLKEVARLMCISEFFSDKKKNLHEIVISLRLLTLHEVSRAGFIYLSYLLSPIIFRILD